MKLYQAFPKKAIDSQPSAISQWPFAMVQQSPPAGQFIARRYRVDPALADLIADLAGHPKRGAIVRYPNSPGLKSRGTSRMAARRIAPYAMALRDRVFDRLKANYPAAF